MIPAVPGKITARPTNVNTTRLLLIAVVALIAFLLLRPMFGHHDSTYEKIAGQLTYALEKNDVAGVEKFQNAETATEVTRGIVGHASDVFAPLGALKTVRETSADGSTHQFDATFERGVVHETIRFDPQNKVVGFRYELPALK